MAVDAKATRLAGRYRVLRRLGAGGMASVYLAEDERLRRQVAVKRLHAESPADVARRFQREARVGASLNHPNIVAVYDTATDDEGVLIVMEYVDGRTLRDEIKGGPLAPESALEVLRSVAAALDHAHANGVVHRDVKPANVLLSDAGVTKLADLGIATAAEVTRITRTGTVLGTAPYLAPERLEGAPGGPAADVYALAAVAFEALSGRPPVTGETAIEVARRVIEQPPPDLMAVAPDAPPAAAAALRRGLAKDPEQRPRSAGELIAALTSAYAKPRTAAKPVAVRSRPAPTARLRTSPKRRAALIAGAAAICALAAVIAALAAGGSSPRRSVARTKPPSASVAHRSGVTHIASPEPASQSAAPAGSTPAVAVPAAGSPTAAVSDFYARAARGDISGAWESGTANLHAELGGLDSFRAQQSTLRSITFPMLVAERVTADTAVVRFQSTAVHTGRTDHCTGTASLVRGAGGWLLDQLENIRCTP